MFAKFLSDAAWYFYLFWLPKYLYDARGFDIKQSATSRGFRTPRRASACLLRRLVFELSVATRLARSNVARKLALGLSAAVMPLVFFVPHAPVSWAIVILQPGVLRPAIVVHAGDDSADRSVSERVVGSVAGLVGFGGAMGGVVFGQLVRLLARPRLRLRTGLHASPARFTSSPFWSF